MDGGGSGGRRELKAQKAKNQGLTRNLNNSYPAQGTQKLIEIEDERLLRVFMEKRMGQEVPGDSVGPEFAGYIFKITGGNDKQGFPMKQGVMHPTRVRLLLSAGHSCYRPRRTGERKRKSVRGCIVGMDLAVLSLTVIKQGEADIAGLTDVTHPKRLGPKRATKIRRFFGLSKDDDVCYFLRCLLALLYIGCGHDISSWTSNICFEYSSANSSFVVRSSPRVKERSPTPRPPESRGSSLLSVSSTSATGSLSRRGGQRLLRRLLCVPPPPSNSWSNTKLI